MIAKNTDNDYMQLALELAAKGELTCAPNPQVGCILVRDGRIVGQGYHHEAGSPHAEVYALREAGAMAEGADVYVTLEPCSHTGRTPPCVDALIAAKVARVVMPFADPFPQVRGQGIAKLQAAGITVTTGVKADSAAWQNRLFLTPYLTHKPYVIAKWAMTTDGQLLHPTSRWISNEKARAHTHTWRQRMDAILVGKQTVIQDNPALTTRIEGLVHEKIRHPRRLILSHSPNIPIQSCRDQTKLQLSHPGLPGETWWLSPAHIKEPIASVHLPGITQWQLPSHNAHIDLSYLLTFLDKHKVGSLFIEGGPQTLRAFFDAGLIDEAHIYIDAPNIHDLPWPSDNFWSSLKSFNKIAQVTFDDNTWLQYAKPSHMAEKLNEQTTLALRR